MTDTVKFSRPSRSYGIADTCDVCDEHATIIVSMTPHSRASTRCDYCGGERAFCAAHWREFQQAVAAEAGPAILTGNRPEDGVGPAIAGLVQSFPWGAVAGLHLPLPTGEDKPKPIKIRFLEDWPVQTPAALIEAYAKLTPLVLARCAGMSAREAYEMLKADEEN
jgi:hypothetical protein